MDVLAKVVPIAGAPREGGSGAQSSPRATFDAPLTEDRDEREQRLKAEVVSRAQAGDVAAQAEFFAAAWPLVRGLTHRLLPGDTEADDLAQDVCVIALDRLSSLREPGAWSFWLRGITVRVVRRRLRTRGLLRRIGLFTPSAPEAGELLLARTTPAEVELELRQFVGILRGIDAESRLILSLRHLEEWSLPEIAAHLEISLSTVKRRYQAAQEKLRGRFDGGAGHFFRDFEESEGGAS